MDFIITIVKTIVIYFFILISLRVMGKKELGQLSVVDLIVGLLIAELAALSLEDPKYSLFRSVIPITTLILIQIGFSRLTLKNKRLRNLIEGKPTIIIKDGKLNFNEMSKIRYSLDDLILQLREQGIKSIDEVNYAVLENNGKLSVFATATDYPMPIILDGVIDKYVLHEIGKDMSWLMKLLDGRHIHLEDVFYAFHTKKKTFIIKKDELV